MMLDSLYLMIIVGVTVAAMIFCGNFVAQDLGKQYRDTFTQSAKTNLGSLFLFIEPQKLFASNLVMMLIGFVLSWVAWGLVVAIIVLTILAIFPRFLYRILQKRRRRKFVLQLPDSLMMISSSMKSGGSLINSIETMVEEQSAPVSQEFSLFLREQRMGVGFVESLDNMLTRMPEMDFKLVVAGMQISKEVGGNLAEVLERLADTLRRKIEMEGKIDALTGQGRMQGVVMTGLPIFLGFMLYHMEPASMARIFTEPMGWATIAVATVMLSLGYFFIRKIVNIDV